MMTNNILPWAIFANFPNSVRSKQLGCYSHRAEAESAAYCLRRRLPHTVSVKVVWIGNDV